MTADRLRDAARVLRERAESATTGPWVPACAWDSGVGLADSDNDDPWLLTPKSYAETRRVEYQANATYIATMSPPVALALADWLSWKAGVCDSRPEPTRSRILASPDTSRALAVTDAILGDRP